MIRKLFRNKAFDMLVVTTFAVVAVVGYLFFPGQWQWHHADSRKHRADANVIEQVANISPLPTTQGLVDELRNATTSTQNSPLILTYHDVGYRTDEYSVTPEAFAAQMKLIHDAGWTTLTAKQLTDWLAGKPIPPHSVAISFDDGVRGIWHYADQILAKYNQHAIAYIITGFVGTSAPYYVKWDELTTLYKTGRWDLEAHTDFGHVQMKIDNKGTLGPFLTNYKWLPEQNRLETAAEWHTRILTDLTNCKKSLVAHGFPVPALFAYPFSAHSDEPNGSGLLVSTVNSLFTASMLDQAGAVATSTAAVLDDHNMARMDVTDKIDMQAFADLLRDASPLDPHHVDPLDPALNTYWTTTDDLVRPLTVNDRSIFLDSGPKSYVQRMFARFRSSMWNDYTVSADLAGLGGADSGTSAGLAALAGDPQDQVYVSVSSSYFQIVLGHHDDGPENKVAFGPLPTAQSHYVRIEVHPYSASVFIDGGPPLVIPLHVAGPHSVAGGITITGDRESANSPVPLINNLTVS
jgi:hypothetical protein